MRTAWMWIAITANACCCAEWTERELRKYRGRIEYTSEGSCDCFYLTLHEKKGWGVRSGEAKPYEAESIGKLWLPGSNPRELLVWIGFWRAGESPQRAIRLVRGAESRPVTLQNLPDPRTNRSDYPWPTAIFNYKFNAPPQVIVVPEAEARLFPQYAEADGEMLLQTVDKQSTWWTRVRPNAGPLRDALALWGPSDNGDIAIAVYDFATRTPLVKVRGVHRKFAESAFKQNALWLDSRYLILPATLRQEIIYVCDIESKRQKSLVPRAR